MKKNIYIAFFTALCMQSVYASDLAALCRQVGRPLSNRRIDYPALETKEYLEILVEQGEEAQKDQDQRRFDRNILCGSAATSVFVTLFLQHKKYIDFEQVLSISCNVLSFVSITTRVFPWKMDYDRELEREIISGKKAQEILNSLDDEN